MTKEHEKSPGKLHREKDREEVGGENKQVLPEGWSSHVDDYKRPYYYNSITGVSTWTLPMSPAYVQEDHNAEEEEEVARQRFGE